MSIYLINVGELPWDVGSTAICKEDLQIYQILVFGRHTRIVDPTSFLP